MGAEVGRNPEGWETSVEPQNLTEKGKKLFGVDKLVCPTIITFETVVKLTPLQGLHQMHRDIVYTYPPQSEQLGDTPRTKVPALYVRDLLISVQGHPEFNGEIVTQITQSRYDQGLFDQALYDDAMSRVHKQVSFSHITASKTV